MKKLALILAMVCFVLVLGAAQELKQSVAVSGSATAKVGFNLDTGVFALKNSFGAGITFNIIPKATAEKKGEGTYGYIKLADFEFKVDDKDTATFALTAPKITAKIISGPMFVTIMDESNATKDISAGRFGLPNITDGNFLVGPTKFPTAAPKGSYLYLGYDTDMVDVTLKVSSLNDYCALEASAANDADGDGTFDPIWFIQPKVSVTVSGVTVAAGAILATEDQYYTTYPTVAVPFNTGFGASLSYTYKLNDKINIVPTAGFDMELADPDAKWAAGAGLFAKWGGNDEYDAYLKVTQTAAADCATQDTYALGDDVKYQGGAGFSVQGVKNGAADMEINAIVQVNEQRGDAGLIPGLGAAIGLELDNLTAANSGYMGKALGAYANYKVGDITPFVRAIYKDLVDGADPTMTFGIGADVANIIPNTKLTLDYNSWNVINKADGTKGIVSAALKVSF